VQENPYFGIEQIVVACQEGIFPHTAVLSFAYLVLLLEPHFTLICCHKLVTIVMMAQCCGMQVEMFAAGKAYSRLINVRISVDSVLTF